MSILLLLSIVLIVPIVGIIIAVIMIKNKIITMRERCYNARAQISVSLETKWKVIEQLVDTVKMCSETESVMLQKIVEARVKPDSISKISEDYEVSLGTVNHILILQEQYPMLQTIDAYKTLISEIKRKEDVLVKSKLIYNDCVMKYNRFVASFPVNLLKEKEEEYWQINNY